MLRYHLNLDINPSTEEMREKQELLDQYERKTMSERMTVSLHAELNIKIEDTEDGKSKMHEIMDIKLDFMTVAKLYQKIETLIKDQSKVLNLDIWSFKE